MLKLWAVLQNPRTPLGLVLIAAGVSFALLYGIYGAVPGNSQDHPLGWWGWADQGWYLEASRSILSGHLKPEAHFYPPLYPLLAAFFLPFTELHPYLPLTVLLYTVYLWAFMTLFGAIIGRWSALLAVALGLLQYWILVLQWVVPWTSSLAAALEMCALLLFYRFLTKRCDPSWSTRGRIFNGILCGSAIGLLAPTRPVDFLAFLPLLCAYAGILLRDFLAERPAGGRSAVVVLGCGIAATALPVAGYLGFNTWLFGAPMGGYFSAVENAGGAAPLDLFDRSFSHLIDANAFFAEASADWRSTLPFQLFFLCFVPFTILFGTPFLRVVAIIVLWHLTLVYSYADALPTGQFRYYNIHYFKWMYPVLPVFFLDTLYRLSKCRERPRIYAGVRLAGGVVLAAIAVSVYPTYKIHRPVEVAVLDGHTLEISFASVKVLDFVDVRTSSLSFGHYEPIGMRVQIDKNTDLRSMSEQRLIPRPGGIRILFTHPQRVRTIRLSFAGTGLEDFSSTHARDVIAGKVGFRLGVPWKPEPLLPYFPPELIETNRMLEASNSSATAAYFGDGWSEFEDWGRWMDGRQAVLQFELPEGEAGTTRLILEGQAFLPQRQSEVMIDVFVNETRVGVMKFDEPGGKKSEFVLPQSEKGQEQQVRVKLRARTTMSPADAGMSADARQLSFGITRFGVLP